MPDFKKYVTLVFDEIKIKSGLVYSKSSGQVGYTDLGPITNELEQFNRTKRCHANAECWWPGDFFINAYPSCIFPTKNANSHELYHCIWPTVKALTLVGLTVCAFVAAGASWNRKFFLAM